MTDALLAFLPVFEAPGFSYGEWPDRRQVGLVLELPSSPALSPEADAFVHELWRAGFVLQDANWPLWRAEAQAVRNGAVPADVDAVKRVFTVAVRTDYAMPGFLLQVMREGTVVRLLRRLRDLDEAARAP